MERCDVAIIGAGLSGLACARRLLAAAAAAGRGRTEPLRVVVLEARDRVGGRTLSVPLAGGTADLGGQWVGPTQHRTLRLIEELGLQTVRQTWFDSDGGGGGGAAAAPAAPGPDQPAAGCSSGGSAVGAAACGGGGGAASGGGLNSGSSTPLSGAEARELALLSSTLEGWAAALRRPSEWGSCGAEAAAWDALSVQQFLDARATFPAVRRELELLVRTVTASEPSRLSLFYFLAFLGMCGGLAAVGDGDGGAQSYRIAGGAQQLSTGMAAELAAAPGVEVRLGAAVTRVAQTAAGTLLVATASEPAVEARCVVVALSPPLWAGIAWSPPLPADKAEVGGRMYMGSAVKTVAVYGSRFWERCVPQAPLEGLGPVANLFPSSVGGRPALVGLVCAGSAPAFAALPDEQRREAVLRQYERYFGCTAAVQQCTEFASKDWIGEPYSRGCYAALMPPGLATGSGASARRAVGDLLFFAGTELACEWAGYFEGAIEAGYRAADEVAAALGL